MAKDKKKSITILFGKWEFGTVNYLIFLAGIINIVLAYIIMALGDTNSFQALTIAPIMLVLGYLVIIPVAILYKPRNKSA